MSALRDCPSPGWLAALLLGVACASAGAPSPTTSRPDAPPPAAAGDSAVPSSDTTASAPAGTLEEAVRRLARGLSGATPEGLELAVLDIQNLEGDTPVLGRYVAERLTTLLSPPQGDFSVIERRRLDQVLGELEFVQSDLVRPQAAKKLGQMVGVDALIVGSLTGLGSAVEINVRVVRVETTAVLAAARARARKNEAVTRMLGDLVEASHGGERGARSGAAGNQAPAEGKDAQERGVGPPREDLPQWRGQSLSIEVVDLELEEDRTVVTFMLTRLDDQKTFEHFDLDGGRHDDGDYLTDDRGKRYMAVGSEPPEAAVDLVPGVPVRYSVVYRPLDEEASSFRIVHKGRYQGDLAVLGPISLARR